MEPTKLVEEAQGRTVAILYADPRGHYPKMSGVDCWDEARDARLYAGPHPVVAHPPCGRWCSMARVNEKRWGARVGDDGGCFASAINAVRNYGGVLEHPAKSLAWARFGLVKPLRRGWSKTIEGEWVAEVAQSAWGNAAQKLTWLMLAGGAPVAATSWSRPRGTHQVGGGIHTGFRSLPRMPDGETHKTPPAFAEFLVSLARLARPPLALR